MNLSKLFELQKVLDEKIIKEKNLEGRDLLPMKILALQVELGELANEWRGFKFWSKDQSPRKRWSGGCDKCDYWEAKDSERRSLRPDGSECDCYNGLRPVNTVLEEYVDCLHFILTIGLELGVGNPKFSYKICGEDSVTDYFRVVFWRTSEIIESDNPQPWFNDLFTSFYALGEQLGFNWTEVEQAYITKNEINHVRQANGY